VRICMLHRYYFPSFAGGAIKSRREAHIMMGRGHKVWVLTPRLFGLPGAEELDGIPVVRPPAANGGRTRRFLSFMLTATRELIHRRDSFDILQLYSLDPFDLLPIAAAKVMGKKVVYQMTMMPPDSGRIGGRAAALVRLGLRMVDGFAVLSKEMIPCLRAAGVANRPMMVHPNHVDTAQYCPASPSEKIQLRRELGLDQEGLYICFVGSVVRRKGVDVLIRAFIQVADQRQEARLIVVGPNQFAGKGQSQGKAEQRNQAFAEAMKQAGQDAGLTDRIFYTGRTDRVQDYLRASDMFVFPSRREGMPGAVIEAMSTALPCVVSDLNGVTEGIITHGVDGYIVTGHDPEHYAHRILELLQARSRAAKIGRTARQTAEQRFDSELVTGQYMAFCRGLLGGGEIAMRRGGSLTDA